MDMILPNSVERILLDEATIQQRVQQMADIISTDYAGLYDRIDAAQVRTVCQKYLGEQTARWLYLQPLEAAEG